MGGGEREVDPCRRQLLKFLISCSYMELNGTVSELPFRSGKELFDNGLN